MAVINGTPAGEPLNGTAGNDTITGAGGADTITMLGGSDLSLWSLGDGSDVVEGGTGIDTARLASTGGFFNVSASGSGTVFVAAGVGAGAEIVSLDDVERLEQCGRRAGRLRPGLPVRQSRRGGGQPCRDAVHRAGRLSSRGVRVCGGVRGAARRPRRGMVVGGGVIF